MTDRPRTDDGQLVGLIGELASQLTGAVTIDDLFHQGFRILSRYVRCDIASAAILEQNLHLYLTRRERSSFDDDWLRDSVRASIARHLPFAPARILSSERVGLDGDSVEGKIEHQLSTALTVEGQVVGVLFLGRAGEDFDDEDCLRLDLAAPVLAMALQALRSRDQIQELADTDELTGSWNKRSLKRQLAWEVDRSRVYKLPLSLMMLDVDDFKRINDEHGHVLGDVMLSELCGAIRETLRPTDFFARFGGDEFAILMPHTDREGARAAAERIHDKTSKVAVTDDHGRLIHSTISIGVATYKQDEGAHELLKRADERMYEAKRAGKDRIAS